MRYEDRARWLEFSVSSRIKNITQWINTLQWHNTKKWSFISRISSVKVTKFPVYCGFGHIYWRNTKWKTSFFVQCGVYEKSIPLTLEENCLKVYQNWTYHIEINFKNRIILQSISDAISMLILMENQWPRKFLKRLTRN